MAEIEKKDSVGMIWFIKQLKPLPPTAGVYLLPSYAGASELDKQKALVEKILL